MSDWSQDDLFDFDDDDEDDDDLVMEMDDLSITLSDIIIPPSDEFTPDEYKELLVLVQDIFARPFSRKQKYLFTGLVEDESIFVLGNVDDAKYKHCDPDQAASIIKIKDPVIVTKIRSWLRSLKINDRAVGVIRILDIISLLNKTKGDPSSHPLTLIEGTLYHTDPLLPKPVALAYPMRSYFLFEKYKMWIEDYMKVFYEDPILTPYLDVPLTPSNVGNYLLVKVPKETILASNLGSIFKGAVKAVLIQGLDLLITKSLDTHTATFIGMRLWVLSGRTLAYAFHFNSALYQIVTMRINTSICHPSPLTIRTTQP